MILMKDKTEAVDASFVVSSKSVPPPVTVVATGLAGTDVVNIQISSDDGQTYSDLWSKGTQVQLTSTNNARTLYGPGHYRVSKPITTGAVTVGVSSIRG